MTPDDMWLDRVVAWRTSGLSAVAFCEGKPFTVAALRGWSSRLGRAGKVERSQRGRRRKGIAQRTAAVTFARIVSAAEAAEVEASTCTAEPDTTLVVTVGDIRIEVARGFDPALLRSVVQALSAGAA